ncbi:MAG: MarR family winged helix-turn-helix transcriptional regulator [Ruminiclostridium sp.]
MSKETMKENPMTLVTELSKLFDSFMRVEMMKNGMKTSYRHLLRPLAIKDGVTQLDLVKISHLKAPTVSTTLRNMEADGLVRRETDKEDARATRVFLTERGREIDNKMRKSVASIDKLFLEGVTAEEQEYLLKVMKRMKENMERRGTPYTIYEA